MKIAPYLLTLVVASPLAAQDACPRASGPDAEAGWAAYSAGDIDGARARFQAALRRCDNDEYARTGMGYVELRQARDSVAAALWTRVLASQPDNVDALVGMGLAAWRAGDVSGVRTRFSHVLEVSPAHPTALDYMARITLQGPAPDRPPFVFPDTLLYPARTSGERFEVRGPSGWIPFYIKGVNLGAALPGRHPSEFPDSATYADWIRQMAEMGANVVRVYTIHPPDFYEALYDWNRRHPSNPLWLIHGAWTELPPDHDFTDPAYESEFFTEMRHVVDLLHGRADIQPRPGHASGYYTADVSPWTLAYIIGREWEPVSAIAFDSIQGGRSGFQGRYVTVHGGNAMDAWMGKATEEIVAYETETYHAQRPVAYTNWPTLDPLTHPTEATVDEEMAIRRALGEQPKVREREYDNDGIALDAALVTPTERLPAGYFASFHAYPYYPDFMLLDAAYQESASSLGRSNYFGYLQALKDHHRGMPVVISEYSVPASLGTGHLQTQGWHHGGLTEAEVADIDRRLTLELAESGMAGGALFAWIDEWFKRNWVTIEFELPQDRNRLWYNRLDAEQHYGVVAMEAAAAVPGRTLDERLAAWRRVEPKYDVPGLKLRVTNDEAYLWLLVETEGGMPGDTLMVGFDMIDPGSGDFRWPGRVGDPLPVGLEFVLEATGSEVRVLADPPSNPFRLEEVGQGARHLSVHRTEIANEPEGLFHGRVEQRFNLPFYTVPNDDGRYDSLEVVVNRRRFGRDSTEYLGVGYDRGVLPGGAAPDGFWERTANGTLEVRIPWLLLNVTDPSSRTVLQGPGVANTRDAELGADGIWRLKRGIAAWPDSIFGELGTQTIESIGLVAAVRGGTAGSSSAPAGGASVARYSWPTWEEPDWTQRVRPTYDAMRDAFERLDPYGVGAGGRITGGAIQVDPANEAWVNGDTGRALELYEQRLLLDPNDGVALQRVALMMAWAENYDRAHELFARLLRVEPDNLDARVDEARVWAWAGETDRALDDLAQLLAEHPDHAGALEARALFEAWAGRYEESLSSYDQLLAIAPDNGAARRQQAQVLSWASRFDASRAVYDSILARNPDDVESRLGLATALAFSDDLDESIAEYDRILAGSPDHLGALQGKGRVLGWANRLVDAESVLRHALTVDERNTGTLVGLAQVLRWQDRNAAALEMLRRAEEIAPTNSDVREQLRGIHLALDPTASPSFVAEHDSDGNTMLTTSLAAAFHPTPRVEVRADGYWRDLQQSSFGRSAMGGTLTASYQMEPGWTVSAGGGGSHTDGGGGMSTAAYRFGLRSPARHPLVLDLSFASSALDVTAALAENGVTTTGGNASLRWTPAPGWRIDAAGGRTRFSGVQDNDRTNGFLSVSNRIGRALTVGGSARFFWFQQDLTEGYFDPDFYGIAELTGRWLERAGDWTLLLEIAPGLQQVTKDGDPAAAFRGSASVAYQVAPGREVSLSGGYSSTGLQSFSTGASDYRYTALIFGMNWVF
jgi:tetratricopeptide (TPR) repeat protein